MATEDTFALFIDVMGFASAITGAFGEALREEQTSRELETRTIA